METSKLWKLTEMIYTEAAAYVGLILVWTPVLYIVLNNKPEWLFICKESSEKGSLLRYGPWRSLFFKSCYLGSILRMEILLTISDSTGEHVSMESEISDSGFP